MPIDANILLQQQPIQLPNVLAGAGQIAQIQGAQQQNRLAQLQYDQAQRTEQQQIGLGNAYKDAFDQDTGKLDSTKLIGSLATGGYGAAIPGVQKSLNEQQKAQAESQKAQLEVHGQQLGLIGQVMGAVKDQGSYDAAVSYLRSHIPDGGKDLPTVYDPNTVQQVVTRALTTQQQVAKQQKDLDYALNVRQQTEVERNNQANNKVAQGQLGVAQGQLGVSRDRLNFDKDQPKGIYDKDSAIIVDPRTGQSRPVTDQNGNPITPAGGKPSGEYLKQATAYRNMDDALTNYKNVLGNFTKVDALSPEKRAGLNTAYQNMMLQAKEMYNLGVLNGGDERILTSIVNNPLDLSKALVPTQALLKQASDLQGIVKKNNENLATVNKQKAIPLKSEATQPASVPDDINSLLNKYGK